MSRLHEAQARLELAVARLERAVEVSGRQATEGAELVRALATAQAEGKALREVGGTLSNRLDRVIGRLQAVLDAG